MLWYNFNTHGSIALESLLEFTKLVLWHDTQKYHKNAINAYNDLYSIMSIYKKQENERKKQQKQDDIVETLSSKKEKKNCQEL